MSSQPPPPAPPARRRGDPRELAYAAVFGAAALLLPVLFHLLQLGRVFMPMYLPLVALAFFVRPGAAALTAVATPLISAAATGMPPWYPPVALLMAVELGAMAWLIAAWRQRWPQANEWLLLAVALGLGRVLSVVLVYATARLIALPAAFVAGVSFVSGWPGIALMLLVVPPWARSARRRATAASVDDTLP